MQEAVLINFGIYLKELDDRLLELDRLKEKAVSDPHEYVKLDAQYEEVLAARESYKKLVIVPLSTAGIEVEKPAS